MFQNNLLMGAAAAASGGASVVSVGNSALYVSGNDEKLTRTPTTAGNRDTWTFSCWYYRGDRTEETLFCAGADDNNRTFLRFGGTDNDQLEYAHFDGGGVTDHLRMTQMSRDIGWLHIVLAVDTTQPVESSRVIIYINGERVTAFGTANYPAQNVDTDVNATVLHTIGDTPGSNENADGYMAETVLIDGLQLAPTSFGAYDSSGLYWTPLETETIQELTFGTNGFYLSNTTDLSSNMTTFVDSGPTGHTITTGGSTTHSGLGHKVQNSVIYTDGTTDYISVAPSGHADFTLGTGDFCIEGWFNRTALSGTGNYSYMFDFRYSGNDTARPACYMDGSNNISYDIGSSNKIISTTDPATGAWYHLAIARNSGTTTMYLNGTSVGSFSDSTNYLVGRPWFFEYPQSNAYCFTGYATELRISKGVPRYTGNFTPSTTAFVSDSDTSLLVHSNKFFGVANDDSGKYNHFINNNTVTTNLNTPTNMYAVLNPLNFIAGSGAPVLSQGNTRVTSTASTGYNSGALTTIPMGAGGKYYFEVYVEGLHAGSVPWGLAVGIAPFDLPRNTDSATTVPGNSTYEGGSLDFEGSGYTFLKANAGGQSDNVAAYAPSVGEYLQVAFDSSNGKIWYGINNTWHGSGNPSTGANPDSTLDVVTTWHGWVGCYSTSVIAVLNFGATDFEYTPPTGFGAITTTAITDNTTRTASDTNKYFQTVLYEGNGAGQRVGAFQPFTDTFTVAKSALYPATGYLTRTFDEAGNRQIFSLSSWFKIGQTGEQESSSGVAMFGAFNGSSNSESTWFTIRLNTSNQLVVSIWNDLITTRTFEDVSQWYHLLVAVDTTQSTASDRIKVYINGVQETSFGTANYPTEDATLAWGVDSTVHYVGKYSTYEWNGYLAQTAYITGTQLTPSSFGQTDTSTNRWIPKDISGLTFGSAGFFLDYADSGNVGDDESGNTNDFTNNNSVAQVADSPTRNNNVFDSNSELASNWIYSNGNRTVQKGSSNAWIVNKMSLPASSGKFYAEVTTSFSGTAIGTGFGVTVDPNVFVSGTSGNYWLGSDGNSGMIYVGPSTLDIYCAGGDGLGNINSGLDWASGDYFVGAFDADKGYIWFGLYDASATTTKWFDAGGGVTGNPSTGANPTMMVAVNTPLKFAGQLYAYDTSGSNGVISNLTWINEADWSGTAPTDFKALTQDNIASSDQFISAFSWIKNRDAADNNMLFDRVRGVTKDLHSNVAEAEVTNVETVQRFLSAGVQVGSDAEVNTSAESYALWNFMMQTTGSGSSNEAGSINTTSTLVDTTLGLSISKYTGTGSNATVGHGLGVAPNMMLIKNLGTTDAWSVYYGDNTDYIVFNTAAGTVDDATMWNDTSPTSTVFSIGSSHSVNASSEHYIAYCFANSQFISVGTYTGNENVDGTFVPTINSLGVPIQPVWVMVKNSVQARSWNIIDTARNPYNVSNYVLEADTTTAQQTGSDTLWNMDIVTGGFKLRSSHETSNGAETMIYLVIGTPIIDTSGRIIAGR